MTQLCHLIHIYFHNNPFQLKYNSIIIVCTNAENRQTFLEVLKFLHCSYVNFLCTIIRTFPIFSEILGYLTLLYSP